MTENTPTPDEGLRSRIEQMVANQQSWIDAGRSGQAISRDAMRDALQRALDETAHHNLETVTAERDARAAILAEAQEQAAVGEDETLGKWAYRSRLMVLHRDVLSKLPADALAARDADKWDEGWMDRARRDVFLVQGREPAAPHPGLNPYRVEREDQR